MYVRKRFPGSYTDDSSALLLRLSFFLLACMIPFFSFFSRWVIFILLPIACLLLLTSASVDDEVPSPRTQIENFLAQADFPLLFICLIFLTWILLSCFWTPFQAIALTQLGKSASILILISLACLTLRERVNLANLYLLPIGVSVSSIVAIAYLSTSLLAVFPGGELRAREYALLALFLLFWPALAVLTAREKWVWANTLLLVFSLIALLSPPFLLLLFIFTLGMFLWASVRALHAIYFLRLAIPAAFFLMPLLVFFSPYHFTAYWPSLDFWHQLLHENFLRFLTGHGNSFITGGISLNLFQESLPQGIVFELWYEYGAIGVVSVVFIYFKLCTFLQNIRPPLSAFLIASIAYIGGLSLGQQALFQSWWIYSLGIYALIFLALLRFPYPSPRPVAATYTSENGEEEAVQTA